MKGYPHIKKLLRNMKASNKSMDSNSFEIERQPFFTDINDNEKILRKYFGTSPDVIIQNFSIRLKDGQPLQILLVLIDGITNTETIRDNILDSLIENPPVNDPENQLEEIQQKISSKRTHIEENLMNAIYRILKGKVLLLANGYNIGILIDAEEFQPRAIKEPDNEQAVRGAQDGFVEVASTNLSLLRERIAHPSLQFETIELGEISRTGVSLAYIKGIVDPKLLNRVKERLSHIQLDAIESSGQIEQLIEDHPYSIFPTIGNTQRPDKATLLLLEGRILIITEGAPFALVVPFLFMENMYSIEDYNSRPYYSSFIRLLRFFAFIISITLPALYISALNFQKEIIPSDMIVPIIQARETVPFPLAMEVIMMILMFEVVREAGVRLPQQIGSALSIVGALILGEVSVSAGLVGAPTIVVVSLSYIAAFVITPIADVTAILRLFLFISSSIFGSFGLIVGLLGIFAHMISLTSMGVPYMAPFAPFYLQDWKDSMVRFPTRLLKYRPKSIPNQRPVKIKSVPDTGGKK